MQNELLNCYINGKKSAFAKVDGIIYLMSHSLPWNDGTKLNNMLGWKYAKRVTAWSESIKGEGPDFFGQLLTAYTDITPESVVLEGSAEYAEIRANIRKVRKHGRRGNDRQPAPIPAPAECPAPVPVPDPAPAPAPVPEKREIFHALFSKIRAYIEAGIGVYLYGPSGSGKSKTCMQLADALGLSFHYTNSVFDSVELEGYRDANGVFHDTEFYRAFKYGGLFMLDELDVSIPDALKKINAALANKFFVFAGERVEMHPDFRCIAAGNTIGKGATEEYTGNVLDASSLDRFPAKMYFDYDRRVELALAGGDAALVGFIHDLRTAAKAAGITAVFSYRLISTIATMRAAWNLRDIMQFSVFGGWDRDEIKVLAARLTGSDEYSAAARALAGR